MLSFIHARAERMPTPPTGYCSYLEPFQTLPTYSQMLALYLQQLMLSLIEAGEVSSVSSAPDAVIFRRAIRYLNDNIHHPGWFLLRGIFVGGRPPGKLGCTSQDLAV